LKSGIPELRRALKGLITGIGMLSGGITIRNEGKRLATEAEIQAQKEAYQEKLDKLTAEANKVEIEHKIKNFPHKFNMLGVNNTLTQLRQTEKEQSEIQKLVVESGVD
jgi:hypothetical protein